MTISKVKRVLCIGALCILVLLGAGAFVLWRLFRLDDPNACISEELEKIQNVSGISVEVIYTNCDLLAKEEWVKVYFSSAIKGDSWFSKWRAHRTLVFKYDPGGQAGPPKPLIQSQGEGRISISVPIVGSIFNQRKQWRGVLIDYRIGRVFYP